MGTKVQVFYYIKPHAVRVEELEKVLLSKGGIEKKLRELTENSQIGKALKNLVRTYFDVLLKSFD